MGRFDGFYSEANTSQQQVNVSVHAGFVHKRQSHGEVRVSKSQQELWEDEYNRCSELSDYKKYLLKYKDPNNPFIQRAKESIEEIEFDNCSTAADYKGYLNKYPNGEYSDQAREMIEQLEPKPPVKSYQTSSYRSPSYQSSSYQSSSPKKYVDPIWTGIKNIIGVLFAIIGIVAIYAACTEDSVSWGVVAPLLIFIVGPVCAWAFDD